MIALKLVITFGVIFGAQLLSRDPERDIVEGLMIAAMCTGALASAWVLL